MIDDDNDDCIGVNGCYIGDDGCDDDDDHDKTVTLIVMTILVMKMMLMLLTFYSEKH